MRTVHEWYLKINSYSNPNQMNDVDREWVEKMINEAREEAIVECSKISALKWGDKRAVAIRKSILSLINELK